MRKMKKSGMALLLAVVLCLGVIPMHDAYANNDVSQPQIESVEFHDNGKTVKEYDEVSFTVKTNLSASEISCFMVGFMAEDYGTGSQASFEEVEENTYLVKTTINGFVGQVVSITIDVVDMNWNNVSYMLDDVSFAVEANVADVDGEITLSKDNVVVDEDDLVEGGTGVFYQERVDVTLAIQGKCNDIYSSAYVEYEYGEMYGNHLSLSYDASSSTDTVTIYRGELFFNQFSVEGKCVLGNVYLHRMENGQRELVQCPGRTLQIARGFADKEAPEFIDVSIDRQGETIKDGKIVVTLKARDNVAIGNGSEFDYVSMVLTSPLSYVEAERYFSLEYQGDDVYTVEIDLEEWWFYQCEWFINFITLYDTVGNKTIVEFGQESPHYFYIEKDGECIKEVFSNLTINLLDNKGKEITSITKDVERRTAISDVLGTEYLDGTKTDLGKFLGWSMEKGGTVLSKEAQFLTKYDSENTTSVNLYEVYEKGDVDITPPIIESLVFEQDGKVINKNEQISFILQGYDEDSEITSAHIVANGDKVGFSGDGVVTPVEGKENTYKVIFDAYCPGEFDRIYIEIIDSAGNYSYYDFDKISLTVQEVIIYADVKGEIIVPDHDIVLSEEDISEYELLGNYLKNEYFYIELEGDYSQVYKSAAISIVQEDGTQFKWINFSYDEDKSTSTKTVYTGRLTINERDKSGELSLSDIEFYREGAIEGEKATFEKKTVQYIKDLGDDETPKIEKISIDKQGLTVSGGTVTITIQVSDNKELKNANGCYVDLQVPLYNVSTEESWKIIGLEYIGNNKYSATINVSELYPTEWFLNAISIVDFAGNETHVWLNTTSPYYFYVEKDGVCNPQVYKDSNVIIYNSENQQVTSFTKDLERRSTIQDVVPAEYLGGSQTNKGEFIGWKIKGREEILTKDSQFLLDNDIQHWNIQLQEVYEDTVESEPTPKPDSNVTIVEDKKTEEAVQQETQKVIMDVLTGRVSDSVVDEKTAENISEAIRKGQGITAEIVVKKMKQEEITQNDKNVIEDKVTSVLGTDAKVQYLDVTIVLKAGTEELGTLNELEKEITITVAIPEELKADGRTYKVIRNHNGEVEVLDTVVNEDGTISFKTDRFSTYALAYADEDGTDTNPNPGNNPSIDNNKPSTDDNKDTNTNTNINKGEKPSTDAQGPKTGDNSSVVIYVAMCLVALLAIVVIKKRSMFAK